MKKVLGLITVLLVSLIIGFSSCTNCSNQPVNQVKTEIVTTIDVDHAIALDRQTMYANYKDDYRWYETDILLPYFLDSDSATSDPEEVVNILQSVVERGNGADVWVHKFQHFKDGTVVHDSVQGFWIEDFPLNRDTIKVNYKQAFDRMMQANFKKPHSKHATLRNPIGPVGVNAQWIFGNIHEQIWIDAVTGDAKDSNPAFPKEKGFKMPLGEWP